MKRVTSFVIAGVFMLVMSGVVSAGVLLDEQFNGDLSNWTVLNGGGTTTATVTGGKLDIAAVNPPQYVYTGVESKVAYALPSGPTGKLIVDFYGMNVNNVSAPNYLLSQYQSTSNVFQGWNNYIGVKGKDSYFGDWVQWTGVSSQTYTAITAIGNASVSKHMIVVIDAANINVYIANDFFENLVNPVAAYTTTTSSIFNSEWTGGVYVNMVLNENVSWSVGTSVESFEGVRVSSIPEPISAVMFGVAGVVALLRKKK